MFAQKAQVSTEYLLITGFILVIVTIIFTYSFVSSNQNIKASQASNALDRMANAADLVYALGPENTKYIEVAFPRDTIALRDIAICENGDNEHAGLGETACYGTGQNGVKAGAIEMQVNMVGGIAAISRSTKAEVELDVTESIPATEGFYRIKVYWCGEKICLKRT